MVRTRLAPVAVSVACILAVTGCNWLDTNYESFSAEGYRLYVSQGARDTKFWFDVLPEKLNSLGGPDSPDLRKLLDKAVKERGICRNGYRITNSGGGKGYYSIAGECAA